MRLFLALALVAPALFAQPKVLYATTSAGFRHDCLAASAEVIRQLCSRGALCELTHTEDLAALNPDSLAQYKAVLFYTSGELALSDGQKQALLDYVARGGSFGGFHSATDTLYTWQGYGSLIGAYFDGHPWAQEARVAVDRPDHPIMQSVPNPWTLTEEYYQFRNFVPENTTVMMSLDTTSVDLSIAGVNARTFPLAWVRQHVGGRVFYTALGHFEQTWRNPNFQKLVENALRWMLADPPRIAENGIGNAATLTPGGIISAGSLISIYGSGFGEGSSVSIGGTTLPVLYAGPFQINAYVGPDINGTPCTPAIGMTCRTPRAAALEVRNAYGVAGQRVFFSSATPGIFAVTSVPGALTVWATGVSDASPVNARVGDLPARVLYSGVSPQFAGLWQINVSVPDELASGSVHRVEISNEGASAAKEVVIP